MENAEIAEEFQISSREPTFHIPGSDPAWRGDYIRSERSNSG